MIYKNDEYKQNIIKMYNKFKAKSKVDYEDKYIDTKFGKTHILTAGNENSDSIIIFHGGNMINTNTLFWFDKLAEKYRIIAPDYLGHPGLSEEKVLNSNNDDYANWIVEIMDNFKLEKVNVIGPSFGGGVALNFAKYYPNKIEKMVLIAPSSIGNGSYLKMFSKLIFPMLKYKIKPSQENLYKSVYPMFLHNVDEDVLEVTSLIYQGVKIQNKMPKMISNKDLINFNSPVFLIACENDIFFPAKKIIPRAKKIFANLKRTKEIRNSGHSMNKDNLNLCIDEIISFLRN
ncbi:alpha/beta fold hydrolase [Haloimpatiens sp. FM7330]|uniref:alpha/beta fold hydrolase n=1 Tax=Haloimpatiens sp. FM7330 TaxID=3298610 RepID=UPI00364396CC